MNWRETELRDNRRKRDEELYEIIRRLFKEEITRAEAIKEINELFEVN